MRIIPPTEVMAIVAMREAVVNLLKKNPLIKKKEEKRQAEIFF